MCDRIFLYTTSEFCSFYQTPMKRISILAASLLLPIFCHAQQLSLVQSPPLTGTFFSMQLTNLPPLPFNPAGDLDVNVYAWGNAFLVDDREVDYVSLREEQTPGQMMSSSESVPSPGEGGGGGGETTNSFAPAYNYTTNELWLEITGVTNGAAYFAIHTPETNAVYDLFTTTNLTDTVPGLNLTNWLWLMRTTNAQTNIVLINLWPDEGYFRLGTMQDSDADGLTDAFENFVSHTASNNADTDADGMPDGWEWMHFGKMEQTANDDYDGDGVSNLQEYLNQTDPNKIKFFIELTNNYVKASSTVVQLKVTAGVPSSVAVLVDSTNFSSATWSNYGSSNIMVNLGSTEGWHEVRIGLRGRQTTSQATWESEQLKIDNTAPLVVITSPTNNVGSQPFIQIKGYSPEPLAGITFDVTNGVATLTNEQGFVKNQFYDTNTGEFTTNWFQCFDVELAAGTNTVILRVEDLAGNVRTTNLIYVVDFSTDTNAPLTTLYWPQDGTKLGTSSFTWRGILDDPTATVKAETISDGVTNRFEGLVERNGLFWIEDISLVAGTNLFTLTATDAAGNSSITNLSIVRADFNLMVNDLPADLNQSSITVQGTIDSSAYTVWVNGIKATLNNGTWTADGVPVNEGGTAVTQVRAIPNTDNGGNGTANNGSGIPSMPNSGNPSSDNAADSEAQEDKPPEIYLETVAFNLKTEWSGADNPLNNSTHKVDVSWTKDKAGYEKRTDCTEHIDYSIGEAIWDDFGIGRRYSGWGLECGITNGVDAQTDYTGYIRPSASSYVTSEIMGWHQNVHFQGPYDTNGKVIQNCTSQWIYHIKTGGKGSVSRKNLFTISASAARLDDWSFQAIEQLSPQSIRVMGTSLGADGILHIALPDNEDKDITPNAPASNYSFSVNAQKHKLSIYANTTKLEPDKVGSAKFCVGQNVTFLLNFDPPVTYVDVISNWKIPDKFVNEPWQEQMQVEQDMVPYGSVNYRINNNLLKNTLSTSCWFVNDPGEKNVSIGANLRFSNGQKVSLAAIGKFDLLRPHVTRVEPVGIPGGEISNIGGGAFPWLSLTHGIMHFRAYISQTYPGKFGITQLTKYNTGTGLLIPPFQYLQSSDGDFYLDGSSEFYDGETPVTLAAGSYPADTEYAQPSEVQDPPSVQLIYYWGQYVGSWKSYVRFTPVGAGSIPITLERIDWGWSSWAEQSAPYFAQDWAVDPELDTVSPPTRHADDEFPKWTVVKPGN